MTKKKIAVILILFFSICLIAGWIYYIFNGHQLIRTMYDGRSVGFLNKIIKGQSAYPVEYYFHLSDFLVFKFSIVFFSFGLFIILYCFYPSKTLKAISKHKNKIILIFLLVYLVDTASKFVCPNCLNKPIIQVDYISHFVESVESLFFFKTQHQLWGYSPYHFAGYPSEVFITNSNHWAMLLNIIFGGFINKAFVFNISIFFSYLILPGLIFFTAKNFNLGKINSLFFFLLSTTLIMGFPEIEEFYNYGMYGYIFAVFLSFFTLSILYKYVNHKNTVNLIKLTFFGSLTLFVHPFSSVIFLGLSIPFLILNFDKFDLKDLLKIFICVIVAFLPNLIWIIPIFRFANLLNPVAIAHYLQTYPHRILVTLIQNFYFMGLLLLFLFFVYKSFKNKEYKFSGSLLSSYSIFFILSFFGSQMGFSNLQPYRFIVVLALISVFSVSILIELELIRRSFLFIFLLGILIILLSISPRQKFLCGYDNFPEAEKILEFIKTSTSEGARIHIQDSPRDPYFFSHFIGYIPYVTKREVLAGPYPYVPTRLMFAQFVDDYLFGKNLSEISESELKKYLELYNIKYFLVFSESAHCFFQRNGRFEEILSIGPYSIYEYLDSDDNYCLRSNADVKADYNKIIVKNASSDVTILKYHYVETLRVCPEYLTIKPIKLLNDPVPFIMVMNKGCSDFVIYNK